jgi:ribosome-associated toxin RatA of RatAB toxin-antitoxin module
MPKITKTRRVAVPADIAYQVAADVKSYVLFVPLLKEATIIGPVKTEAGKTVFDAQLVISYKKIGLRESFRSHVTCDPTARKVTAESQEAPFKNLKTQWIIREADGGAEVDMSIDFTLRSMLHQIAASAAMGTVIDRVIGAFELRAKDYYSRSKTS